MRFLLMPDSFKGTLTSAEICAVMERALRAHFPTDDIFTLPIADGGEGTVDAFLTALGGEKRFIFVNGPFFEPVRAFYGLCGKTAVIETASCAGLPLAHGRLDPCQTTTFGLGEILSAALDEGAEKIILGLGGSCTNDGGAGMAAALGARFLDASENEFVPTGGTLSDIARIDGSGIDPRLQNCEIIAMCDVTNPLCGPNGASAVFAPQKGADANAVALLDQGLAHLASLLKRDCQTDVSALPGAGAAGGLGAGCCAFLGARLQSGISLMLNAVRFHEICTPDSIVFTGEGKLDAQSLGGKAVSGIAAAAAKHAAKVIAVAGGAENNLPEIYDAGITAVFTINRLPMAFEEAKRFSAENLFETMDNIARLLKIYA